MAGKRARRQKDRPPEPAEPTEFTEPVESAEPPKPNGRVEPAEPVVTNGTARPGGAAALSEWWERLRANAAQTVEAAQVRWARSSAPRNGTGESPAAPADATRLVPALRPPLRRLRPTLRRARPTLRRVREALAAPMAPEREAPNALAIAWADPARRPWLLAGAASVAVILLLIGAGLSSGRRAASPPSVIATQPAQPAPAQPTAAPPAPAPPAQPAPEQPAPAQPAPAAPPSEAGQPAQPARPAPPGLLSRVKLPPATMQMALAALPLLLGLFWLLSAWLVDSEARRAFVVQEPWGERRTMAYSCLAVGCVFPLILAGLIFAAYGFVEFVIYVATRQSWLAGIQSGALILLVCACFLLLRGAIVRWQAERRARLF